MLEADDDLTQRAVQTNIYIAPPSDTTCSDEDSGDEDSGGSYNNLTGKQLQAILFTSGTLHFRHDDITGSLLMTFKISQLAKL